jgi:hypothetical protein
VSIAILAPGPLALPTGPSASDNLANAVIPLPSTESFAIAPDAYAVPLSAGLADPRPDAYAFDGVWGPAEDLVILDHIHVIPRRRDLGAVISEQTLEVEVWNAFLSRAKQLQEITVEGPPGVSVIDHLGQPAWFPASDSQVYVVEVSAEGDPLIDNFVTWVFVGVDETGTDLHLLGFRLIPFPFPPNMVNPIVERFGYLTDIIEAFRGDEQRIQLRAVPVGSITYSVLLDELREAQMANAILHGNQARAFGVGRWQFQTPLVADALADELDILCDTNNLPFEVDGLVLLWTDPYHWEAQRIAEVQADRIVISLGLRSSWLAQATTVLPLVIGRLSTGEDITWESLVIASQALTFSVDGFRP